ncbi:MAG: hypothetical protein Q7U45_00690, partial [Burkholderiaceae bacterium]|nr:hypothetical protein [Burkholderiaceae bacterium]
MDTPSTTHPAQGCSPAQSASAKGGIVGAHTPPVRPAALAWLTAGVLALHLGALAWWLLPSNDTTPAQPATQPLRMVATAPATPPHPVAPSTHATPATPAKSAIPAVAGLPAAPAVAAVAAKSAQPEQRATLTHPP